MFDRILVPVDVSVPAETQRLLISAKKLAEPWGSELHVVAVIPNVGMAIVGSYMADDFETQSRKAVKVQLADAIAEAGVTAKQHVLTGTVYDSVIELAASLEADLIVIGAHQPELRDYLIGSNAARVVRHSRQSVLVMREI